MGKPTTIEIRNDEVEVSDGYHTFSELYAHRVELFINMCRFYKEGVAQATCWVGRRPVWKSKRHSDGSGIDGWFLLGIGKKPGEQITYHLPTGRWDDCDFVDTLERAPEFDGHTSDDVLKRLKDLC